MAVLPDGSVKVYGSNADNAATYPKGPLALGGSWLAFASNSAFFLCGDANKVVTSDSLSWELAGRFLAKYNPAGRLLWAVNLPNDATSTNSVRCTATEDGGAFCLVPVATRTTLFRYNDEGQSLWSLRWTNFTGKAMAVDRLGDAIVAGVFGSETVFGESNLAPGGQADVAVLKVSSTGTVLWARQIGGALEDTTAAVAVGAENSVVVAGTFVRKASSEGIEVNAFGEAGRDVFVGKFSSEGTIDWINALGDFGDDTAEDMTADDDGNVYLCYAQASPNSTVTRITKISGSGTVVWETLTPGSRPQDLPNLRLKSVVSDRSGNILSLLHAVEVSIVAGPSLPSSYVLSPGASAVVRAASTNTERDENTPMSLSTYVGLTFDGRLGRTYRIDFRPGFSTDTLWQTVTNITLPSRRHLWVDPESGGRDHGYYRAILLP
jgi:hypothetical protein